LLELANENEFRINKTKTVTILFRKGRRNATEDYIEIEGDKLEMVSSFKYFGITVLTTGFTNSHRIKAGTTAAVRAM
jgi:S-adenosylmethionine hydrolase